MINMKKLLMIIIVAVVLGGLGYGIYDSVKPKEKYEIKLWNNIYNGDSIALFYEEESDLRIEMLRALYNLDKIDKGDDEINYILKVSEAASKVVTLDNVDDTKALNGYDIIRLIGEKRIVSAKDMAIIVRDFITSVGYDARIGEIRCSKKDEDKYDIYYIVEYYSDKYNKWIAVDIVDGGYFTFENTPCSGVELVEKGISQLKYIGKVSSEEYFSDKKDLFKSYTIMIDNTVDRVKSNSVITYITSKNEITLTYGDKALMPTIYTENRELFTKAPNAEGEVEDDKAYIILMKSEEEGVERFVVGGFKNGKIMDEYYVGRSNGTFEKVNEYFELELIKGKNMISISCDGVNEDARIEITYNQSINFIKISIKFYYELYYSNSSENRQ